MHTAILYQPMIAATDLAGNVNVNTLDKVTILNADGSALGQAMYATPGGVTPIANPISPNNAGYIEVYTDRPQAVMLVVNGQDSKSAFSSWPEVPYWYEDVRVHGASLTATAAVNRAAVQEAVDTVIARGGGTVLVPELYHIDAAIVVSGSSSVNQPVKIVGVGRHCSGLYQDTLSADVLVFGAGDSINRADSCGASDLTLQGGNRGLRLNNAISGQWSNLFLYGNQTGLQTEGQCEKHQFSHTWVFGSTTYGMHLGADNGVVGAAQELQKTVFTDTIVQEININAAAGLFIDGGLGTTGNLVFDGLCLEDGPGTWIQLGGTGSSELFSVSIYRLTIEESGVPLNDPSRTGHAAGFTAILQGSGCQKLSIYDSVWLHPTDDVGNAWNYVIDQQYGRTMLVNCDFTAGGSGGGGNAAGVATLRIADGGLLMLGGIVGGQSQILFAGPTSGGTPISQGSSLLLNVLDAATNRPIQDFGNGSQPYVPFIAGNGTGIVIPDQTVGYGQSVRSRGSYSSLAGGALIGLTPHAFRLILFDTLSGKMAEFTANPNSPQAVTLVSGDATIFKTSMGSGTWSVSWYATSSTFILRNETGGLLQFSFQMTEFLH